MHVPPNPIAVRTTLIAGLFVLALVVALRAAQTVILPVVVAVLLSFLLSPVMRALNRLRLPNSFAAALVVIVLLAALASGLVWLASPASEWMERLPETARELEYKLRDLRRSLRKVSEATEQVKAMAEGPETGPIPVEVQQETFGEMVALGTRNLVLSTVVVFVLLYYLLASGDGLLINFVRLPRRNDHRRRNVDIVRHIRKDVANYLLAITVINVALGAAVGVAMWLLGMPNPILWGVMAALLNYVPYMGALVGCGIVLLAAVVTFDSTARILIPPGTYLLLTNIESYVVTPLVLGARLTLNPAIIVLGLIFWSWLWGVPGALLAIPLLMVVKILCDRVRGWQAMGRVLGQ